MHTLFTFIGTALFVVPQPVYAEKPILALEAGIVPTFESTLHLEAPVELSVEEKIRLKAREYGYSENRAVAIAKAESGLNPKAKSTSSSASGVYQFIKSTWAYYCTGDVFNEDDNIDCAVRMLSEGGESHWSESRFAWGKII